MSESQRFPQLDRSTCNDAVRRRAVARRTSTPNAVRFIHRAPQESAFREDETKPGSSPAPSYSADSRTSAVLIVGSYGDCDMYAEYFRSIGFLVEHVRKPEEAMRYLQTRRAVIICDMVFENSAYDGPTFMQAIRRRPECSTTNVIVVSGYTRAADRQRARAAGADLFLLKPCAPEDLWRHVDRALWAYEHSTRAEWNWPEEVAQEQCISERRRS